MSDSPVDQLLDQLSSALMAKKVEATARIEAIEHAVRSYRTSVEERVAFEFAVAHGFKQPRSTLSPRQAAERLRSLVAELPELEGAARAADGAVENSVESHSGATASPRASGRAPASAEGVGVSGGSAAVSASAVSALVDRCKRRKLVIIGALSGRQKPGIVPDVLAERIEWVDTERDGVHAIGNLPQRIRQDRVGAVVILDKAVQHKHTEPIVAAARDSGTPVAFAGKGGRTSLLRAIEELDERLAGGD